MSYKNEPLKSIFSHVKDCLTREFHIHSYAVQETKDTKYSSLNLKCMYPVNHPHYDTKMENTDY